MIVGRFCRSASRLRVFAALLEAPEDIQGTCVWLGPGGLSRECVPSLHAELLRLGGARFASAEALSGREAEFLATLDALEGIQDFVEEDLRMLKRSRGVEDSQEASVFTKGTCRCLGTGCSMGAGYSVIT